MDDAVTVTGILQPVLALSPQDRKRPAVKLGETLHVVDAPAAPPADEGDEGRTMVAMPESLDISEREARAIDDPVGWLRQQREDERKRRLDDWHAPERQSVLFRHVHLYQGEQRQCLRLPPTDNSAVSIQKRQH
jgi:hypothetical protein